MYKFSCKRCGYTLKLRSENVNEIVGKECPNCGGSDFSMISVPHTPPRYTPEHPYADINMD